MCPGDSSLPYFPTSNFPLALYFKFILQETVIRSRSLIASLVLALCAGLLVWALWSAGLLVSVQEAFLFVPRSGASELVTPQSWLAALLIIAVGTGAGFVVERLGARRASPFIGGGLLLLSVASLLVSKHLLIDIVFAPMALAASTAACLVQLRRLWSIELLLARSVRRAGAQVQKLEGETTRARLTSGLKLLETMLPLDEAVVFKFDEEGALAVAARLRWAAGGATGSLEGDRNFVWRAGLRLCERAIKTGEMTRAGERETRAQRATSSDDESFRLALPLRHDERAVGALLMRLREELDEGDREFLLTVGAQLARDLQRELAHKRPLKDSRLNFFSAREATNHLEAVSMMSGMLAEQRCNARVLNEARDGHAIAYLDGTIAHINRPLRESMGLTEREARRLNLFTLLDHFRGGVFDEPSIAVRRVLRTGEPYQCEIQIPERNRTMELRLASIVENNRGEIDKGELAQQPRCLAVTVRDVTLAREYDKLRSDMIALMSHEMRTPLTSINGFAELLAQDEKMPADAREFLSIIRNESQRLSRMINTFLSVAQLESANPQDVSRLPLKLDDIVRETVTSLQPVARKKRIRLVGQETIRLPPIAADKSMITQALTNLVSNAIKYSPERTTVTVSTALEAEAVRVSVEDCGYGIPPESVDRVWEKFYRVARDGQEKDEESTGLGLSFVREVVEQHGGCVALESEVGRGSKFSFTLPRL
jgi:signal transduction histidine kinase